MFVNFVPFVYALSKLAYTMACGNFGYLQKFNGTSDNLDRFFVQFHIACQLNKWPENQKALLLGQCLEGPALLQINGLLQHETFCQSATLIANNKL